MYHSISCFAINQSIKLPRVSDTHAANFFSSCLVQLLRHTYWLSTNMMQQPTAACVTFLLASLCSVQVICICIFCPGLCEVNTTSERQIMVYPGVKCGTLQIKVSLAARTPTRLITIIWSFFAATKDESSLCGHDKQMPLVFQTIPWSTVDRCGPLWSTVVHYGPLWSTMDHCGPLWSTVVHCGPLWSTMVHYGPLWTSSLEQLGIFFPFLISGVALFCPLESRLVGDQRVPEPDQSSPKWPSLSGHQPERKYLRHGFHQGLLLSCVCGLCWRTSASFFIIVLAVVVGYTDPSVWHAETGPSGGTPSWNGLGPALFHQL